MEADDFADQVAGVATLADPIRRALYRFVVERDGPVSRDEASAGVDVARHTAKFHLDRLVDEGLLATEFKRLSGRQGPGAGRPTKLYRPSARELSVTVPARRYEVAGHLMATAIEASAADGAAVHALHRAAADRGRTLGDHTRAAAGPGPTRAKVVEAVVATLSANGYVPHRYDDTVTLANCPFQTLAREHTELVCGMNLAIIEAMVERGTEGTMSAHLDPAEGRCCVTMTSS